MYEDEPLTPELQALEARLAGLAPTAGIDRDKLMFEAGRAAVAGAQSVGRRAAWSVATLLASVAALLIGRWTAPHASTDTPLVAVAAPLEAPFEADADERLAAPDSYAQLRRNLGSDTLAHVEHAEYEKSPSVRTSRNDLMQELLN